MDEDYKEIDIRKSNARGISGLFFMVFYIIIVVCFFNIQRYMGEINESLKTISSMTETITYLKDLDLRENR